MTLPFSQQSFPEVYERHLVEPLFRPWADPLLDEVRLAPGDRLLDVACGTGIVARCAQVRLGATGRVIGVDVNQGMLAVARRLAPDIDWREGDAIALPLRVGESFDVVTCMEMLEHVPDPSSVVRAAAALAKPGGWVFFSTLNRNAKSFLFAILGAEYVLQLLPKGTHEYAKFIRPSELARWCRGAGLDLAETKGMEYNPLTQRYWLSADTSVNYLLACRKP